jgi:hypothetical protein
MAEPETASRKKKLTAILEKRKVDMPVIISADADPVPEGRR